MTVKKGLMTGTRLSKTEPRMTDEYEREMSEIDPKQHAIEVNVTVIHGDECELSDDEEIFFQGCSNIKPSILPRDFPEPDENEVVYDHSAEIEQLVSPMRTDGEDEIHIPDPIFPELMIEQDERGLNERIVDNREQDISSLKVEKTKRFEASEVISVSEVNVPPYCEVIFSGKVKRAMYSLVAVIEEVRLGSPYVHVARAIIDVDGEFPTKVINTSPTEFVIKADQVIGVAVSAEQYPIETRNDSQMVGKIEISGRAWLDEFSLGHIAPEIRNKVESLLIEFSDLFRGENDVVKTCRGVKHSIVLEPGAVPVYKKPYRIPYKQREVVKNEIDRLLRAKVVRPSVSPWSSPIVLVTKRLPDGQTKIRMCVDYRGLNSVTKKQYFPLPNISDLVQSFRADRNLTFSMLDLSEAYHHIPVEESSIPYTAFSTYEGHYEYLKLPFGLCHAPVTFQKYINFLFHGLLNESVLVYLDDIVIYTYDGVNKHLSIVREVFRRLREANLQLKPEKCNFLMKKVKYLGHILSTSGISPEPNKIQEIQGLPIPKNVKGVRQFLGAVNFYRKFIPDMARKAGPLVNLTKKGIPFRISGEVLEAIETLKNDLSSESLLVFPDFSQPFIVASDASKSGLGAILSQVRNGFERPISFVSRRLTKAETNYSASELELLGVTFAVKQFRCYIYNSRFTIVTDHIALKYLLTKGITHSTNSRLIRFALLLSEYDFDVVYRKGKKHCNADLFSRKYDKNDYYVDSTFEEYEKYCVEHAPLNNSDIMQTTTSIFEMSEELALAHWVTEDGKARNPIDKWIIDEYGSWKDSDVRKGLGEVVKLRNQARIVYALVAHNPRFGPTSYEVIFQCLQRLKENCLKDEISELCIPEIDFEGTEASRVIDLISFVFYGSNIRITLCHNKQGRAIINNIHGEEATVEPQWDRLELRRAQDKDAFCKHILNLLDEGDEILKEVYYKDNEGVLYRQNVDEAVSKLVVPEKFINKVLNDFHDTPWAGHSGRARTTNNIKKRFFWPNMLRDIVTYCDTCVACNRRKTSPHFRSVPLLKFETVREPFELCSLDVVGPLVTSYNGNKYILTFMDYFTRYCEAIPVADIKAETVARAFVEQVVCRHGCPAKLLTDRGTNFMSEVFREVCKLLQIEKVHTASYAPSTNGMIERFHRTMKDMLSQYVERSQRNWDQVIPYILLAYRMTDHSATGYSPHFLLYGRECVLPVDRFVKPDRVFYGDNYVAEMMARMQDISRQVIERNAKSIEVRNFYRNRGRKERNFELGDLVYLKNEACETGVSKKLSARWSGPYRITGIVTPVTYRIQKAHSRQEMTVHANRLKKCVSRNGDKFSHRKRRYNNSSQSESRVARDIRPSMASSHSGTALPYLLPDTIVFPQVIPQRLADQPGIGTPRPLGTGERVSPRSREDLENRRRRLRRVRRDIGGSDDEPEAEGRPRRQVHPPERYDPFPYRRSARNRRPVERYQPGLFAHNSPEREETGDEA